MGGITPGALGKAALEAVLNRGGGLVGICAGAYLLSEGAEGASRHCYGWLPVACGPAFGDNGLVSQGR